MEGNAAVEIGHEEGRLRHDPQAPVAVNRCCTPYEPRSSATKREQVRRLTSPAPSVVFCSSMISAAV